MPYVAGYLLIICPLRDFPILLRAAMYPLKTTDLSFSLAAKRGHPCFGYKDMNEVYWWYSQESYYFPDIKGHMLSAFCLWSLPFLSALVETVPHSCGAVSVLQTQRWKRRVKDWWMERKQVLGSDGIIDLPSSMESPTCGFLNTKENNSGWVFVICSQMQFWDSRLSLSLN